MIYLLEFSGDLYEFNGSFGRTARAIKEISDEFSRTMLLHRYDLGFFAWSKHQCKNPDSLTFEKLDGDRLVMMHLAVYKDCPERILDLVEYCEGKEIDFIAPITDGKPSFRLGSQTQIPEYQLMISDMLRSRTNVIYDFLDTGSSKSFDIALGTMMRDMKLRRLLG